MATEITIAGDLYGDSKIFSGSIHAAQTVTGQELQYDVLSAELDPTGAAPPDLLLDKDRYRLKSSDGKILYALPDAGRARATDGPLAVYHYGAEVYARHNGVLLGKFYLDKLTKVWVEGQARYRIECVSPIGILAESRHYGGIYPGVSASAIIRSIIGDAVPYSVAPEVASVLMYGWLPVAKKRENLHQVLFALGAVAAKDENGDIFISPAAADTYQRIPDGHIYFMDEFTEREEKPKTVSVYEHSWVVPLADEKTETLYQGEITEKPIISPQTGQIIYGDIVLFEEPVRELQASGTEILEQGFNYAILSMTPDCTLSGRKFIHSVRQVTSEGAARIGQYDDKKNELVIDDAWLVSIANSESVVQRLQSYYNSSKIIKADILVDGERPGGAVEIESPFGGYAKGTITSMDMTLSGTVKAGTEIVIGYQPPPPGNFYNNVKLITATGDFTVPPDVTKVRVVLIGGGPGGEGGHAGKYGSGKDGDREDTGEGGAPGRPGPGGRILIKTIDVTPGQVLHFTIGVGGKGGEHGYWDAKKKKLILPTRGDEGGATTLGALTSADGRPSASGFTETFSGEVYGITGRPGISGANGSTRNAKGGSIVTEDGEWHPGKDGSDYSAPSYGTAHGGYGGGAAYRANGKDGRSGGSVSDDVLGHVVGIIGGEGGDGGTSKQSVNPFEKELGRGGTAGNGGGGGGEGGDISGSGSPSSSKGYGGRGGPGSDGGQGGPGLAIIYY